MAALTPASAAAIGRLRAYVPPPTLYQSLPLSRRAAVLIILFGDRNGDLRVVLTMRSTLLKSYSGQAALPGGKADTLAETPFQTARREAYEEIGLPTTSHVGPYRVEHLCQLPLNLAKTELGVRPCVAFLAPRNEPGQLISHSAAEALIPRLDAKEVAAVFTAPFHNFLRSSDEVSDHSYSSVPAEKFPGIEAAGFPAEWYKGSWTDWHETRWRMHNFYVPITDQTVAKAKPRTPSPPPSGQRRSHQTQRTSLDDPLEGLSRFRVFGMTARILVDCARLAYDQKPEFEHNSHFGDEEMTGRLLKMGRLGPIRKKGDLLTREDMQAAAKM